MIPFVWSDVVLRHEPLREVTAGKELPGTEVPYRAQMIRDTLLAAGHAEVPAEEHDDDVLLEVHEPALVEWLRRAAEDWADGPYEELLGQDRVVPSLFPTPMMTAGMPWRYPAAAHARAGVWCYDTETLVGPGTWPAARAAVDVALTAAGLVASGATPAAYALTRPPGHHAAPAGFGGSCYLNNAAVAAQALAREGRRVAILDVDAHHGNGTQAVFWQRPDVFYGSVHVDPGAGWFPHVLGYAAEIGAGPGGGTTLNVPLPPRSDDLAWVEAVAAVCERAIAFQADALVVSLGVDGAAADPESPLSVTDAGFAGAGRLIASLELPTVIVQEGGRHLPTLGGLVGAVLSPFAPGPHVLTLTPAGYDEPSVRGLIAELQQEYVARYGGTDDDPVDVADFTPPTGVFLLARDALGELIGSVALRRHDPGTAELKRMYVRAVHRRRGLGRELVAAAEEHARAAGYRRIVLVTGPRQPEAIALYASAGYARVPNFGFYGASRTAMSFAKEL